MPQDLVEVIAAHDVQVLMVIAISPQWRPGSRQELERRIGQPFAALRSLEEQED